MHNLMWIAVFATVALLAGLWCLVIARTSDQVRLTDAVALLEADPAQFTTTEQLRGWDRIGQWLVVRLGASLSTSNERILRLQGRTLADFYVQKLVGLLAGLVFPLLIAAILRPWLSGTFTVSLAFAVVCAVLGWWWPNLRLRQQGESTKEDASHQISMLFDLVVLERLANLSGVQAVEAAATVSHATLFTEVSAALNRARLEQRTPWDELEKLAEDIDVPALAELAEVMRLDDQGASLSSALIARTRDLRDAHLTQTKMAAHEVSERMTLWMTIPVMIFALAFLVPPVLSIAFNG